MPVIGGEEARWQGGAKSGKAGVPDATALELSLAGSLPPLPDSPAQVFLQEG